MKRIFTLIVMLVLTSVNFASEPLAKKAVNTESAVTNLIIGLQSNCTDLQISCAHHLGELKSTTAVKPLLEIFENTDCERLKISSALALMKIVDEKSLEAVVYTALNGTNPKAKDVCRKLITAINTAQ